MRKILLSDNCQIWQFSTDLFDCFGDVFNDSILQSATVQVSWHLLHTKNYFLYCLLLIGLTVVSGKTLPITSSHKDRTYTNVWTQHHKSNILIRKWRFARDTTPESLDIVLTNNARCRGPAASLSLRVGVTQWANQPQMMMGWLFCLIVYVIS